MDDPNVKDFESALAELEAIVQTLEDGQLPLEQSLQHFERGIALSRTCHARLEDAERRVELLTERGGTRPAPAEIAGVGPPAGGAGDGRSGEDGADERRLRAAPPVRRDDGGRSGEDGADDGRSDDDGQRLAAGVGAPDDGADDGRGDDDVPF